MENSEPVILEIEGHVATVTLNRPGKANAFDGAMWVALEEAAMIIRAETEVRVAVLTGAGKSFCGGLDIKKASSEGISLDKRTMRPGFESLHYVSAVFTMYEKLPVPVIAAVDGGCIGLGLELALACDIRIATDRAVFSIPETVFGLVPDCGGTQRLPRLVGPAVARELIYTGRRIGAREALRIGLVNHVYPPAELMGEALGLAAEIAANSPDAVQASKRCLNYSQNSGVDSGLGFETTAAQTVLGDRVKTMIRAGSSAGR